MPAMSQFCNPRVIKLPSAKRCSQPESVGDSGPRDLAFAGTLLASTDLLTTLVISELVGTTTMETPQSLQTGRVLLFDCVLCCRAAGITGAFGLSCREKLRGFTMR